MGRQSDSQSVSPSGTRHVCTRLAVKLAGPARLPPPGPGSTRWSGARLGWLLSPSRREGEGEEGPQAAVSQPPPSAAVEADALKH